MFVHLQELHTVAHKKKKKNGCKEIPHPDRESDGIFVTCKNEKYCKAQMGTASSSVGEPCQNVLLLYLYHSNA